jgi:prepilin-type N-terminal cleavage/methylation domain-containing protein
MTKQGRPPAGFTLVETIVTLGLLAVLAAFVVPTVIQKASSGDPVKVVSDIASIRTGLATFQSDVGGVPNQIRLLVEKPSNGNHFVDSITAISSSQAAAWTGPYLNSEIGPFPLDSMSTGFRGYIKNTIVRYDGTNNAAEYYLVASGGTGGTFNVANTLFAALTISGLTHEQAQTINRLVDGGDDVDVVAGPYLGANTQGRFRYDRPNSNEVVVAFYLIAPLAK